MLPPLAAAPLLGNMTFIRQEPGRGQGEVRPGEVTAVSTEGSGGSQGRRGEISCFITSRSLPATTITQRTAP